MRNLVCLDDVYAVFVRDFLNLFFLSLSFSSSRDLFSFRLLSTGCIKLPAKCNALNSRPELKVKLESTLNFNLNENGVREVPAKMI